MTITNKARFPYTTQVVAEDPTPRLWFSAAMSSPIGSTNAGGVRRRAPDGEAEQPAPTPPQHMQAEPGQVASLQKQAADMMNIMKAEKEEHVKQQKEFQARKAQTE